jgi:hypothetical protein
MRENIKLGEMLTLICIKKCLHNYFLHNYEKKSEMIMHISGFLTQQNGIASCKINKIIDYININLIAK